MSVIGSYIDNFLIFYLEDPFSYNINITFFFDLNVVCKSIIENLIIMSNDLNIKPLSDAEIEEQKKRLLEGGNT